MGAVASLLFGCDRAAEHTGGFEPKSPSSESLLRCSAQAQVSKGRTPLTATEMRREIIGHWIGTNPEALTLRIGFDGSIAQNIDNSRIDSRYAVQGNCLCAENGNFECITFFKDVTGRLIVTAPNGSSPSYVFSKRL